MNNLRDQSRQATIETLKYAGFAFFTIGFLYIFQRYVLHGFILNTPEYWGLLCWSSFSYLSARFEAMYYNHEIHSNFLDNNNEHPLLICIRICVLIPLAYLVKWDVAIAYVFIFPFIHDGSYYKMRNIIDSGIYTKKWFAQSETSTAITTKIFTPLIRTLFFITGIFYIILKTVYLYKFF